MNRFGYVMVTYFVTMGIAIASFLPTSVKLIWNASASIPLGLYSVGSVDRLDVGDLVAVDVPDPLADLLAERGYLPRGVPLLKRVAAVPGQRVCRIGRRVIVDDITVGDALDRDRLGRDLPVWQGCHRIGGDEVFLMNRSVGDSLDGRYFGPIPAASIIGRVVPLWIDERGTGRFEWHPRSP